MQWPYLSSLITFFENRHMENLESLVLQTFELESNIWFYAIIIILMQSYYLVMGKHQECGNLDLGVPLIEDIMQIDGWESKLTDDMRN